MNEQFLQLVKDTNFKSSLAEYIDIGFELNLTDADREEMREEIKNFFLGE